MNVTVVIPLLILIFALLGLYTHLKNTSKDQEFRLWLQQVRHRMKDIPHYPEDVDVEFLKNCFEEGLSPEESVIEYMEEYGNE